MVTSRIRPNKAETLLHSLEWAAAGIGLPKKQRLINQKRWHTATKAWTAIDRLSIIWKSDLTNKSRIDTIWMHYLAWTLTKWLKLGGNYNVASNIELVLAATPHLPPIMKTKQVRQTRHCWRSKDELSDVLWTPCIWSSKSRMTSSNIQ